MQQSKLVVSDNKYILNNFQLRLMKKKVIKIVKL